MNYEDYEEFNSHFDETEESFVSIGILKFRPSKVLYNEDFEAWKEELSDYLQKQEEIKKERSKT